MEKDSKITKEEVAYSGKWVRVVKRDFSIGDRQVRGYECVERNKTDKVFKEFDGVSVAAILASTMNPSRKRLILIAQFRPPAGAFVLEFPAGLVEDCDLLKNAARELEEETGYSLDYEKSHSDLIAKQIPISIDDPGICSGSGKFIIVHVNEDDPKNQSVTQKLESSENIRVHLLDLDEHIEGNISKLAAEKNYLMSTKLYSFAVGFSFAKRLGTAGSL